MPKKISDVGTETLVELGTNAIKSFFEWLADDNEFDPDLFLDYVAAHASVWGIAAQSDGEISEDEEDLAAFLMEAWFFTPENGIYISPEILEEIGMKQKEMKKLIIDHFYNPISMSEICSIAEELEMEEEFFRQACSIVFSDNILRNSELDFLFEFGTELGLPEMVQKRIFQDVASAFDEVEVEEDEEEA